MEIIEERKEINYFENKEFVKNEALRVDCFKFFL